MRLASIALVLCACVWMSVADVAHLKAAKARLAGRLANKFRHHKRGVVSVVPSYKVGHDIPVVTHSVIKPVVVTYPPTASVSAVKIPLGHPLFPRYPVPVGHKVPVPHPHFGLRFPHHKVLPESHFHHHHHHIPPRPVVPVLPAPALPATTVIPLAQPTLTVAHPIPAPSPPLLIPSSPAHHHHAVPVAPPPVPVFPDHVHYRPIISAPVQPAPLIPTPIYPAAPQYVIRPGNAVQTSYFATYPRYPLVNYQSPIIPVAPAAPAGQVLINQPQFPHFHLAQHGHEGVLEHAAPTVPLEPTLVHPTQVTQHAVHLQPTQHAVHLQPTQHAVHLQPTQPSTPLDHEGWSPVHHHHDFPTHTDAHHFNQAQDVVHYSQEQGAQVYEHHTEDQYHELQHQLQHHIQQQIEQAQYEQHVNEQHQQQHVNQEYGAPDYSQQQGVGQEYGPPGQEYSGHEQQYQQEYGPPAQGFEGRSSSEGEADDAQKFHNHIPLGLQPPIDRPLENFR